MSLTGLAGLPTMNRPTTAGMYLFVNGRPVRDRQLLGAVRAGYQDMLPRGRHPLVVLFITVEPEDVDVNVHPAKAEVRFKHAGHVRGLIVATLSSILREAAKTSTDEGTTNALRQFSTHTHQTSKSSSEDAFRFQAQQPSASNYQTPQYQGRLSSFLDNSPPQRASHRLISLSRCQMMTLARYQMIAGFRSGQPRRKSMKPTLWPRLAARLCWLTSMPPMSVL